MRLIEDINPRVQSFHEVTDMLINLIDSLHLAYFVKEYKLGDHMGGDGERKKSMIKTLHGKNKIKNASKNETKTHFIAYNYIVIIFIFFSF